MGFSADDTGGCGEQPAGIRGICDCAEGEQGVPRQGTGMAARRGHRGGQEGEGVEPIPTKLNPLDQLDQLDPLTRRRVCRYRE
jgi:hypothetical protein